MHLSLLSLLSPMTVSPVPATHKRPHPDLDPETPGTPSTPIYDEFKPDETALLIKLRGDLEEAVKTTHGGKEDTLLWEGIVDILSSPDNPLGTPFPRRTLDKYKTKWKNLRSMYRIKALQPDRERARRWTWFSDMERIIGPIQADPGTGPRTLSSGGLHHHGEGGVPAALIGHEFVSLEGGNPVWGEMNDSSEGSHAGSHGLLGSGQQMDTPTHKLARKSLAQAKQYQERTLRALEDIALTVNKLSCLLALHIATGSPDLKNDVNTIMSHHRAPEQDSFDEADEDN